MSSEGSAGGGRRAFVVDNLVVFGAHVLGRLRGLLVLPLIVSVLGTAAFGTWSQALSFAAVTSAVAGLSFHLSLVRFTAAAEADRGRVFSTLLVASTVLLALVALLLAWAPDPLVKLSIGTLDRRLFAATLALMVLTGQRTLILNLFRATNRLIQRSVLDLASSTLDLFAIVGALLGGASLLGAMLASVAVNVLTVIVGLGLAFRVAPARIPSLSMLAEAARYGIPLVPATLASWTLDRGDRFVISHFLDQHAVGTYSTHYALAALLGLVLAPIQTTLAPKIVQLWDTDRALSAKYVAACFRVYWLAWCLFLAVVPTLSVPVLDLFGDATLSEGAFLNVLLISTGVGMWGLGTIVQMPLFASKATGSIGATTFLGAALNLGLNVVLVPSFGIRAAAAATLATYAATYALFARATARTISIDLGWRENARAALAGLGVGLGLALVRPTSLAAVIGSGAAALCSYLLLLWWLGAASQEEKSWLQDAVRRRWGRRS